MKLPQIYKVYAAKNGEGLAASSFLLEQFGYDMTRHRHDIPTVNIIDRWMGWLIDAIVI